MWVWSGGLLLALAVLTAACITYERGREQLIRFETELARARSELKPSAPAASTAPLDFTQSIGPPLNAVQVVQELQRASSTTGVLLVSVQAQERAASLDQLGRLELTVTLRGAYAGTKLVLKQVLERYGNIGVQRLRMRRAQAPTDIETSVTLSVWSKPLEAAKER